MAQLDTPRSRAGRGGDLRRGAGAAAILLAVLIGVPGVLWRTHGSPLPHGWPALDDVTRLLAQPDDGSVFLDVLVAVGWAGWAMFALSVAVELPAAVRGVTAPRVPGLAITQRAVSGLVAAVMIVLPTAHVASAHTAGAVSSQASSDEGQAAPPVTTKLLDELSHATRRSEHTTIHRVVPGETLWTIAEATLGDPQRYPEIVEASAAIRQDDGRRLTDPDVIHPGWRLAIPDSEQPIGGPRDAADLARPTASLPEELPRTGNVASPDASKGPTLEPPSTSVSVPPRGTESGPETAAQRIVEPMRAAVGTDVDLSEEQTGLWTGATGIGVVLASGLVAVLGARRATARRRQRAGQLPGAESVEGRAVELVLRHTADPASVAFVDRALRTLSASVGPGRGLPGLRAARLSASGLEVCLAEPTALAPPFVPVTADGDGLVWRVPAGAPDESAIGDVPAPFPALVSLGHDRWGGLLLADLERCGVLHVTGPPALVSGALVAFAAELATSVWADDLRITLVGFPDLDLGALDTGRVRQTHDPAALVEELSQRIAEDRALLGRAGVDRVGDARSQQLAEATWTPEVVVVSETLPDTQKRQLIELIESSQGVAVAAVVAGGSGIGGDSAWSLATKGSLWNATATLSPVGVELRPQLLEHAEYQRFLSQLRSSHSYDGVARPEPALTTLVDRLRFESGQEVSAGAMASGPRTNPAHELFDAPLPDPWSIATADAPRLWMLGPLKVTGTAELSEPNKRGQLTEIAMFIALNPGCDTDAIDEAVWPGAIVTKTTRSTALSKLRRWLGTDAHGAPWLPRTEGRYTFPEQVCSDWQRWCQLLPDGPEAASTVELRLALSLVRGRPFSGRGRRSYAWADYTVHEMISAIIDACHELAVRALGSEHPREALRAALLGLTVEPGTELLWRDRLKAEVMVGDRKTVLASIETLRTTSEELGCDLMMETEELVEQILRSKIIRGGATVAR